MSEITTLPPYTVKWGQASVTILPGDADVESHMLPVIQCAQDPWTGVAKRDAVLKEMDTTIAAGKWACAAFSALGVGLYSWMATRPRAFRWYAPLAAVAPLCVANIAQTFVVSNQQQRATFKLLWEAAHRRRLQEQERVVSRFLD